MIDREKLIEREADDCANLYIKSLTNVKTDDELFGNKTGFSEGFKCGIASPIALYLNSKAVELKVIDGKIEALENIGYIDPTTYIYSKVQNDIKELQLQREQIINSLNEEK